MPKFKTNSLNGKVKRHSVVTSSKSFLEGILSEVPVEIYSGKMKASKVKPLEPINVREININSKKHYMGVWFYDNYPYFQEFKFFCNKKHFSTIMQHINAYCSRN
jgi:hypothetical protein